MPNPVDCSVMSHVRCQECVSESQPPPDPPKPSPSSAAATDPNGSGASYECTNECVSSLGVTALLSGAVVTVGCAALRPACPVFAGVAAGSILGACDAACRDLATEP